MMLRKLLLQHSFKQTEEHPEIKDEISECSTENKEAVSGSSSETQVCHKDNILAFGTTNPWGEIIEDKPAEYLAENTVTIKEEKYDIDFNQEASDNPAERLNYNEDLEEKCEIDNKSHIQIIEKTANSPQTEQKQTLKKSHPCSLCSYQTLISGNLKRHILNNHTPSHLLKWFHCAHCSYKCKEPQVLTGHISSVHSEKRPFKCSKCDHTTKTKPNLKRHMINKHTPANFEWHCCEYCSYRAKTKYKLQMHAVYKHTSEDSIKWLQCNQCSYKAKVKSDLTTHMSVHSASKNLCQFCGNSYKRNVNLQQHIVDRHSADCSIKAFECEKCSKKWKTRRSLKRHVLKQHV